MQVIDLTGQIFGQLTVIERGPNDIHGRTTWNCQCNCGNYLNVPSGELRRKPPRGKKMCNECLHKNQIKDLTGKRFGRLIAKKIDFIDNGGTHWICQCDCGNQVSVRQYDLSNEKTKSCGCFRSESISKRRTAKINLGDKFGKLTVIEYLGNTNGCSYWKCRCDCGNIVKKRGMLLIEGVVNSCGCLKSKGEHLITSYLNQLKIPFVREYSFKDLLSENNVPLRFDFAIIENNQLKVLIEFDGIQHFEENRWNNGASLETIQTRDKLKDEYCKINNIPLIRFNYKELDNNQLTLDYFKQKYEEMKNDC